MVKDAKVAEVPVVAKPETTGDESLLDNRRSQLEKQLVSDNIPDVSVIPTEPSEPKEISEEAPPKEDHETETEVDSVKKSVQKRIGKLVAQKKSVEEELAEVKAELNQLKTAAMKPAEVKDSEDPTPEQVEAYILRMREEGNAKEEIAATRFLIKLEKELALKEVRESQNKTQKETSAATERTNTELKALANDYMVYDEEGNPDTSSDLTLSNKKGKLFKIAMELYNDPELHKDYYNDPNVVNGFRRAVADAYREIHQKGLIKTPKGAEIIPDKVDLRRSLADPGTDSAEDTTPSTNSALLSDAEKVREEIKARKKNRFPRNAS
jgi:hypothetical protein